MAKKKEVSTLTDSEFNDGVKKIKTKKRFKTKKAFKEYRINNLKRYHFLRKELNDVWDSVPEDKRFRTKKDVLKSLVAIYRDKNDYAYISNTFDVAVSDSLGIPTTGFDSDTELNFSAKAKRDSIPEVITFYEISNIRATVFNGKVIELFGDMFGEPFQVIGDSNSVYNWFRYSDYYKWCRKYYNDSPVAVFVLVDYDGLNCKYELMDVDYDTSIYKSKQLLFKDFKDTSVQIPQNKEKVSTIEENKPKISDKEIELRLAEAENEKERIKETKIARLLKEFELGLITKKEYKNKVKKIEK